MVGENPTVLKITLHIGDPTYPANGQELSDCLETTVASVFPVRNPRR